MKALDDKRSVQFPTVFIYFTLNLKTRLLTHWHINNYKALLDVWTSSNLILEWQLLTSNFQINRPAHRVWPKQRIHPVKNWWVSEAAGWIGVGTQSVQGCPLIFYICTLVQPLNETQTSVSLKTRNKIQSLQQLIIKSYVLFQILLRKKRPWVEKHSTCLTF